MTKEAEQKHSIQVVASRTGLSQDVIRAWERRYGAVHPERSATGRRLYSDEDLERLGLLRRATLAGRRISDVAALNIEQLQALVRDDSKAMARVAAAADRPAGGRDPARFLEACLSAATRMDSSGLQLELGRAAAELGLFELFDGVVTPLLREIGELWLRGSLSIAHEHMATSQVRALLDGMRRSFASVEARTTLLAATPAGEFHELGALKAAVIAAVEGWRVIYLGPNLPARDIAGAAATLKARVVALSLVYGEHDPAIESELQALGKLLPRAAALIVGGESTRLYRTALAKIGAIVPADLRSLRDELTRLQ